MGLIAVYRLTHTKDEGLLEKEKDDWTRRNISRKIPRLKHREEKYRKENKRHTGHGGNIYTRVWIWSGRRGECDRTNI